ncbi:MAG: L,D-transpeptidase family protein, partial [Flavisolibacter sp.]
TRLMALKERVAGDTFSTRKLDASLWAYNDLMLTSAFVQIIRDVRLGRLLPDSVIQKDTILHAEILHRELEKFRQAPTSAFVQKFEPVHADYIKLKEGLGSFLNSADLRKFTYVTASGKDSTLLRKLVYKRIGEEDSIKLDPAERPDSLQLVSAIKKYQKFRKMKTDGKLSTALVSRLNNTDLEKFIRVAINMDRFKQLSPLPKQYLWVNMPGFYLEMRDSDTVVLRSKVVVGKPKTRTPALTSAINNMITYPQWHIPESIIRQEILPGLKRDAGYTKKKGYSIVDKEGNEVDPYSVDWSKFKTGIPYRVIQGSGDDNALGILKFNFPNTHSVYLHDTNQRYLFSRSSRALSHGCVRVQSWNDLAKFILRNDSIHSANAIPVDSLQTWLGQKKKQYIPVRKPIPVFIRYFTCDAKKEGLVFYEDIYGEDKKFRDRIFITK